MSIISWRKTFAGCIALCASMPLMCLAQSSPARDSMRQLDALPSLSGFSVAREVSQFVAPPGDHGQTAAYRDGNGCVTFFGSMKENDLLAVGLKWSGPACNGKPVEGKGTLQIYRKLKDMTVVGVLKGRFVKGMLTGEGSKTNFSFDHDGKLIETTYVFHGTFGNSVLNGQGVRRWVGPANEHPSAWSESGRFVDGTVQDTVQLSRLRGAPGLAYESHQLRVDKNGQAYIHQAYNNGKQPVPGSMQFDGDPSEWKTETATWDGGATHFAFSRKEQKPSHLLAVVCQQASFHEGYLSCKAGEALTGQLGSMAKFDQGEFSVLLPIRSGGISFRVDPSKTIRVGTGISPNIPMRCNSDMTVCSGSGVLNITPALYWQGTLVLRNGSLTPGAASLWHDVGNASAVRQLASCSFFDGPLQCSEGVVEYQNGGRFTGGWRLSGIAFARQSDVAAPTYRTQGTHFDVVPEGSGRFVFADGAWADVEMKAGDFIRVGDCDQPASTQMFSCRLVNGEVTYYADEVRIEQPRLRYDNDHRGNGGRFVPIPNPTRQPYVLPGMN